MRALLKVLVGTVAVLVMILVVVRFTGLNPHGRTPGLWLSGTLITTPVADWSFSDNYPTIDVQTNTWYLIPHSVTIYCGSYQNHLYLQAFGKTWRGNVSRDPRVWIKIGSQLYDRTVEYVTDPTELWGLAQNMNRKYRDQWPLPKSMPAGAVPKVFLRVVNN